MFQNIRISISNVGGLSLPRVTSRRGTSHETVTKRDEGGWVVLKTQMLRDVIIEQPHRYYIMKVPKVHRK